MPKLSEEGDRVIPLVYTNLITSGVQELLALTV